MQTQYHTEVAYVKQDEQGFGLNAVEGEIAGVGESLRFVAVQFRIRNRIQNPIF